MDTAPLIVIIIVGLALWIAMCNFGFRWIFSLKRQLWNQRQTLKLLIMIAEKQGVDKASVTNIEDMMNRDDEYLK
jgi:hypothetical protein